VCVFRLCLFFVTPLVEHLRVHMLTLAIWFDLCAGMASGKAGDMKGPANDPGQTRDTTKEVLKGTATRLLCFLTKLHLAKILFIFSWYESADSIYFSSSIDCSTTCFDSYVCWDRLSY
jgi:hypothetical protein